MDKHKYKLKKDAPLDTFTIIGALELNIKVMTRFIGHSRDQHPDLNDDEFDTFTDTKMLEKFKQELKKYRDYLE